MMRYLLCFLVVFGAAGAAQAANVVDFAYRNPHPAFEGDKRNIVLQGRRDASAPLSGACGATGNQCLCTYFQSANDKNPQMNAPVRLHAEQNYLVCSIPTGPIPVERITHAGLIFKSGGTLQAPIPVLTALTARDLLGPALDPNLLRTISRHSCTRTFFEGEGFTTPAPTCPAHQHLGVITANYDFYTFHSAVDQNAPGADVPFAAPICGRSDFLAFRCAGSPPLARYGLYAESAGPFVVPVSLVRAPGEAAAVYGYAVSPDRARQCPPGFQLARVWLARPASMPGGNFMNTANALNNLVFEASTPADFTVTRAPNATPCAANGDCRNARFLAPSAAQAVPYQESSPIACVVPAGSL